MRLERRFGRRLRELRERRGLKMRELARKARISPAFLSKVERGITTPPAERKLRALAKALGEEPEVMLALAGRLPDDVIEVIQQCPAEYLRLLRELRGLDRGRVKTLGDFVGSIPDQAWPSLLHIFASAPRNRQKKLSDSDGG